MNATPRRLAAPTAGIWRFADAFSPPIAPPFRISLGEGDTPLEFAPALAASLGLSHLWLKREDLNPTGSHKDRGMAFQVSAAIAAAAAEGRALRRIALSSSGNAAVAAAAYGHAAGLGVVAFLAPGTDAGKVDLVRAYGAEVIVSPSALTLCAAWCLARGVPNLRPSTDPAAVEGFLTLGWEIIADLADLAGLVDLSERTERAGQADPSGPAIAPADMPEALFTFVSSATSLVGIGRAFGAWSAVAQRAAGSPPPVLPALHAVQGIGGPVAAPFDGQRTTNDARSGRVGALGARKTRRLGEALRLIRASRGGGWSITDAEADAADRLLRAHGIHAALEAAAAVAAARRAAAEAGIRRAVVVVTGADRHAAAGHPLSAKRIAASGVPGSGLPTDGPPNGWPSAAEAARTIEDVDRILAHSAAASATASSAR